MRKEVKLFRENYIFYLTGLLVILGLKCYYRYADCDSLLWILAPTACWVEFLGRIPFTYVSGAGYVNHGLRMVIAPSCSGVRFMAILFATLVFSFEHQITSLCKLPVNDTGRARSGDSFKSGIFKVKVLTGGFGWIAASALLSWIFTVFVNGLRIIMAVYLPICLEDVGLMGGILTQDRLHTMIGVVVYFSALLTIYRLTGLVVHKMTGSSSLCGRKCAPPVFWYFALTLGLPLLGRISGGGITEFAEFAALVTVCCAFVLLPYVVMLLVRRLFQ